MRVERRICEPAEMYGSNPKAGNSWKPWKSLGPFALWVRVLPGIWTFFPLEVRNVGPEIFVVAGIIRVWDEGIVEGTDRARAFI